MNYSWHGNACIMALTWMPTALLFPCNKLFFQKTKKVLETSCLLFPFWQWMKGTLSKPVACQWIMKLCILLIQTSCRFNETSVKEGKSFSHESIRIIMILENKGADKTHKYNICIILKEISKKNYFLIYLINKTYNTNPGT